MALNPIKSILLFASTLYLTGLSIIMLRALQYGSLMIAPDGLFKYEFLLVLGLVLFQFVLFVRSLLP